MTAGVGHDKAIIMEGSDTLRWFTALCAELKQKDGNVMRTYQTHGAIHANQIALHALQEGMHLRA
jgi:hypothetical protein